MVEQAIQFNCDNDSLLGIVHSPQNRADLGVVIVVGGPQTRVGSHRQFVLLARTLVAEGIPVFRFDYRGMGDSTGERRDFEAVDCDIRAAIDAFQAQVPQVKSVVLWGLCDAASAASFYAHKDSRVRGLVLLNPWVRTQAGEATAYLKHYYLSRFFSRDFWLKLASGKFKARDSLSSLTGFVRRARGASTTNKTQTQQQDDPGSNKQMALPERVLACLTRFRGKILFILAGDDLTADEFRDQVARSTAWQDYMSRASVSKQQLDAANHTFSSRAWRDEVAHWTVQFCRSL